jgi:hypothetical protein
MKPTFAEFLKLYQDHLGADDQPTCFVAYCRAEADVFSQYGERRYANAKVWRNTMSRHYRNRKQQKLAQNETIAVANAAN